MKDNVGPMADALVKEVAKAAKDAKTEVVRSGDLIAYTAEEGVRFLGQGKLLNSDSFPGQERSKMCLCQKASYLLCSQDWVYGSPASDQATSAMLYHILMACVMGMQVPLGVVLCIPPFNYPVNLAVSKMAPALMAGNCVVVKPPSQGAVSALHMIQAFHKAGFPPGVVQCVTGPVHLSPCVLGRLVCWACLAYTFVSFSLHFYSVVYCL